jgi:hypothetical protein
MPRDHSVTPDPAIGPTVRDEHSPQPPDPSMADAPDNQGKPVGPHDPASMHRREDDDEAMASSPDFHDRPGSGRLRP